MTVYAYVRVSTDDQDFDSQKVAIEKQHGIDQWVRDIGTGKITQPNLAMLCRNVKKGDTVIVYAFDRLGRSMSGVIAVVDRFKSKGVRLISMREGVDITSPQGNLMFQLMSSFAEFEATVISSRVKAGMRAAAVRGVKIGRPALKESEIGNARLYRDQGMSYQRIVRQLQKEGIKVSYGSLYRCIGASNARSEGQRIT